MESGISPDDAPQSQPQIVDAAGVVEIISRSVGLVDAEIEGLGDADGLRLDQRRHRVCDLLSPGEPCDIEDVLFLVGAVEQADDHRLTGVRLQNGRCRVAIAEGAENVGRVVLALQPFHHGLTAVVDAHDAGVVVRAGMLRRVQGLPLAVKQQGEVMEGQNKLPVHLPVGSADDRLRAAFQRFPRSGVQEFRSGRLHDEGPEQAVLLVDVGIQVVVEKDGVQLLVGEEPLDERLILPGPGDVVPAVGRAVGHDGVEFHQMDVVAHDVGDGLQLEGAGLNALRQEVGELHLDAVPGVSPDDQRLRLNFAPLHLGKVVVQGAHFFNVLLEDEEAALGVVPAIVVVDHVGLHCRDVKALYVFRRSAGTGVRVQGSGYGVFHEVGFLKNGGLSGGLPTRRQDAKGRLERLLSEGTRHEVGITGVQVISRRRQRAVPQRHQVFDGCPIRVGGPAVL